MNHYAKTPYLARENERALPFRQSVILTLAFFLVSHLSACNWLVNVTNVNSESSSPAFILVVTPNEIYWGQQAQVVVTPLGRVEDEKKFSWNLQEENGSLATNAEFFEVEGSFALSGETPHEFRITSRPNNGLTGGKVYNLIVSSGGYSSKVKLKVIGVSDVATVVITSTPNNGYVSSANLSSYAVGGLCSSPGNYVNLIAKIGGEEAFGSDVCQPDSTWSIPLDFSDVSTEGTAILTATHAGSSGSVATTTLSIKKDTTAPDVAITSPAMHSSIDGVQATGFSVSGTCSEEARPVHVVFNSSNGGGPVQASAVCTGGSWSLIANLSPLQDGIVTAVATHSDEAGNNRSVSREFLKDPTLPVITIAQPAPGTIFNSSTFDKVTIIGTCNIPGATVTAIGELSGPVTTTCNGSTYTLADIKLEGSDDEKTITVKIDDGINTDQKSVTVVKDVEAPVVAITTPIVGAYINAESRSSFAISGTCSEVGVENVHLVGDIVPTRVDCVAGYPDNIWNAQVDFSGASDGPVFIMVSQTDEAGNVGSRTRAFILDTEAPFVAFTSPAAGFYINNANKNSFAVSGTCSEYGANITLSSTALNADVTTVCAGTTWSANLDFKDGNESVEVEAKIEDSAGNSRTVTRTFNKDTVDPFLTITSPAAGAYINESSKGAFIVSGTCSDPGLDRVMVTGAATKTVHCENDYTWSADLDFSAADDGVVSITATHLDAAGNTYAETLTLQKDTAAPEVGWTFPLASTCATDASGMSFEVAGTCMSGDGDVTLSSPYLSSDVTVQCVNGEWSSIVELNLGTLGDLQAFSIQASQTDAAGNIGQQSRGFKKLAGTTPNVVFGGWDDIYAVGPKVYGVNPGEPMEPTEPGVVRIKWKEWPSSNTCMPERVKVYRANAPGAGGTLVSGTDYPNGIRVDDRSFTDTSLSGATWATADSATDFAKGWYYRLKVTIAGIDYDVTQPNEIAEVRVVAPPANMALVHRWIANQEVCGLMNRPTDPANHYRCSYSGWGKITAGGEHFYDFQHDLLVDRFELACNFTLQCGDTGDRPCLSSEFGVANPASIAAADGQVFYDDESGDARCYIKNSGTWYDANVSVLTPTLRGILSTNNAHKPPLVHVGQVRSHETCQGHTVTLDQVQDFESGNKRLLRALEWRAAAAWSTEMDASGFADYDEFLYYLEVGGADFFGNCNSANAHDGVLTERTYVGTGAFYTGSKTATSRCQSRYGIQDMVGNVWEWVSDQLTGCSSNGKTCVGFTPSFDPGNVFMEGFAFDGVMAPGSNAVSEWLFEAKSYGANFFSVPLGLPLLTHDGGNAIDIDSWLSPTNKFHADRIWLSLGTGAAGMRGLFVGGGWNNFMYNGRWTSNWYYAPSFVPNNVGLRCAVPVQY